MGTRTLPSASRPRECPICGNERSTLHKHAPALEENYPDLRFGACDRCHNGPGGLTARQFDVGMHPDHKRKGRPRLRRPLAERQWNLLQGSVDLFAMIQRSVGRYLADPKWESDARTFERTGAAFARLLSFDYAASPGTRLLGSEPAKNRRRWKRQPNQLIAPATLSLLQVTQMLLYLRRFSETVTTELRDADSPLAPLAVLQQDRVTDALRALERHPVRAFRGLSRLAKSETGAELLLERDHVFGVVDKLQRDLQTAPGQETAEAIAIRITCRLAGPGERWMVGFLRDLAAGEDSIVAGKRLLARLVEGVP